MEQTCTAAVLSELTPIAQIPERGVRVARPIQVLLVEDDPESAELVEIGLAEDRADPFRIEWCSNLVAAMNRLTEPGIDVVLLDLGLPELTGYRSYRAIEAAADHKVPVVILTSDERANIRQVTLEFGAADYLLKGRSTNTQLRSALRKAVTDGWVRRTGESN